MTKETAAMEDPFLQHLIREIDKAKDLPGWESWSLHECLQDECECDLKDAVKLSEATSTKEEARELLMALGEWLENNPTPLTKWRDCLLALTQMLAFRFIPQNSLVSQAAQTTEIDNLELQDRNAAVIGASIVRNHPLHLRTSESNHGIQASNLIEGFAALEYGYTPAEKVIEEELKKAAKNLTQAKLIQAELDAAWVVI